MLCRAQVVLVISPLVSLMKDQADQINARMGDEREAEYGAARREAAFYFGGGRHEALGEERALAGGFPLVFVTPEKLFFGSDQGSMLQRLQALHRQGTLLLIAIDEAH
jgi:superfamily II DNA helicase RecQ